jgi:hypothetical protein
MEHWQFLIQKQGDRSWYTLESPNIQLLEGRYRVLARSNLPNTDVEVRVTHSSTQEVPPKRRIQRQSRRTNSEGLMAVIPFTNFKSGTWEIRCSGDLMSDLLGKSWQYSIYVQVLTELSAGEVGELKGGDDVESNSLDFMIQLPYQQTSHEPETITDSKLPANPSTKIVISPRTETNTQSNLVTSELPQELVLSASDNTTISTAEGTAESDVISHELPSEEIALTGDRNISDSTEEITDGDVVTSELPSEVSTSDRTISDSPEEITDGDVVTSELPSEEIALTSNRTVSAFTEETTDDLGTSELPNEEIALTDDRLISDSVEETTDSELVTDELALTSDHTVSDANEETTDSDLVANELPSEEITLTADHTISDSNEETTVNDVINSELLTEKEIDAIIEQPVSPVWLKGETAEQILQNLMELALPSTELLLEDEESEEDSTIQPAPPLLLTLEQDNYIARWGQGLSINAKVELQANTIDEPNYAITLNALEVRIELRSPLSSEILTQVRQPIAENLLPLTINSAIHIPVDCDSKLLLGEFSLYGALTDFGEVMLLASRSFTITADVTELLAIAVIAKSSQQNFLENGSLSVSVPNQQPEATVSLGLELFNLVKPSAADKPQTILLSPNQPLPPQINLLSFKKSDSGDLRSPQLPKLPEIQPSALVIDDGISEVTSPENQEPEQKNEVVPAPTTVPLAPINLEQLAIKNRRRSILGNTFPYLKRLKTVPTEKVEVATSVADESDLPIVEDSQQLSPATELPNNLADESISVAEDTQQLLSADAEHENLVEVTEVPDDSVAEVLDEPTPEVADTPSLEFSDNSITQPAVPSNPQLIAEDNAYSSPLIRKWMQSQGYFVPAPPPPPWQSHSQKAEDSEPQEAVVEEELLEPNLPMSNLETDPWADLDAELDNLEVQSETSIDSEISLSDENLNLESEDIEIGIITEESEELEISAETQTENIPQEGTTSSLQLGQVDLSQKIKIPRAWLAQEIVVDDTYSESEENSPESFVDEGQQQLISSVSNSRSITGEFTEPLPTPQLHIPEGELVAGQSVRVRVELPEVPPQVVVKLWIEDCQTRGLLDGPHLLKDLLPNRSGGVEVMTQINVPFGCVEIRLEAIAFNTSTQQESHKVTIVRTVIPPDLPNLQVDELLGL